MQELIRDLKRFNKPLPRYTSYPTAPNWGAIDPSIYEEQLTQLEDRPLSLYLHVPFCQSMCLYCGCAVILNRRPENEERYVGYLLREIEMAAQRIGKRQIVKQIHFGGGTPTKLTAEQLERILNSLHSHFTFEEAEISIEIDPRTVSEDCGEKLKKIRQMGFNRVSFGVQDTNEKVQEAVRRRQSYEMTRKTFEWAKDLGFFGINIDLIYGLPYQSALTFQRTAEQIAKLRPDRIALFSYAKVPWLKKHQLAMKDETLPSVEEKFSIYLTARQIFIDAGYQPLGMDHFGLPEDPLARAYQEGRLHRNFQGYTLQGAKDMVSFGVTAIGEVGDGYFQNVKDLDEYYQMIDQRILPVRRGLLLSEDDKRRKWTIWRLMCQFELDKRDFEALFGLKFDRYFAEELKEIAPFIEEGLMEDGESQLKILRSGRLFVRNLAAPFDRILRNEQVKSRFSSAI